MKRLDTKRLSPEQLDSHHYVCDLLRAEFPALTLYTDGRQNWLYLWIDTDSVSRHRFLIFTASREDLDRYLRQDMSLRTALQRSDRVWALDESQTRERKGRSNKVVRRRQLHSVPDLEAFAEYLPTEDSFFDPEMAPDVDLSQQLLPKEFNVPIAGEWFGRDFEYLFKRYERLYAFFYATGPRFVRTINATLHRVMRAPWRGGYSRVNMFTRLAEVLPGQHALRVATLNFASPGDVKFEAIPSIGKSIHKTVVMYIEAQRAVDAHAKKIKRILTSAGFNKRDLSEMPESGIKFSKPQWGDLEDSLHAIAEQLAVTNEFDSLRTHSPNTVVFAKGVLTFVRQVEKLSILQDQGLLNFSVE